MKDGIFFVGKDGSAHSYADLLLDLSSCSAIPLFCYTNDTYEVFKNILSSILYKVDLVLLDYDFSSRELSSLGIDINKIKDTVKVNPISIDSVAELSDLLSYSLSGKLTLFTSGTTGLPKKVTHKVSNLVRLVRQSDRQQHCVWAFAYNPTHIAGIQVFFQAIMNGNPIIDVFGFRSDAVYRRIREFQITNISATPTFYRMLLPIEGEYLSVLRVTSGGERYDSGLLQEIRRGFPNAQLRNIYASTEAGSVLESRNDRFRISDPTKCKIEDNRLFLHNSLLNVEEISIDWYDTGDIVKIVDSKSGEFIFVSRASDMINVGGYKANPLEIEEALCLHPAVQKARVWGKPNPITGSIIMADVVCRTQCFEKEIREFLRNRLQDYKIPRVISFVDTIETTRSGKVRRG